MHLGLPMTLIATDGITATVARGGHCRSVSLLDAQPSRGTVVLVHLGTVVCALTVEEQLAIEAGLAELQRPGVELHHLAMTEALG